jgi:hypothetical protein
MKVFVVSHHTDYEGGWIEKVFNSKEKALDYVNNKEVLLFSSTYPNCGKSVVVYEGWRPTDETIGQFCNYFLISTFVVE